MSEMTHGRLYGLPHWSNGSGFRNSVSGAALRDGILRHIFESMVPCLMNAGNPKP